MKRIFNVFKSLPRLAVVILAVLAVVGIATIGVKAGLGSDRPVKAYYDGVPGFDHVTFNSFTGVPNIGDERNFFTGKIDAAAGGFYDPMTQLRDGDTVLMRVYVHNNADSSLNASGTGVAKDVNVRVALPDATKTATQQVSEAFISASNAQPQTISDTLTMGAENGGAFSVSYVPGSATVTDNDGTQKVDDSIVTTGASLGNQNGCFKYVKLVTLKVKIKMPSYTISKTIRKDGSTSVNDWQKTLTSQPGDTVQWRIAFQNTGSTSLNHVKVVDNLPEHVSVVPGSVELVNGNYPNGYQYPASAVQANGKQINVDIGNYNPTIKGFVVFKTKIDSEDKLACGVNNITNTAFVTPEGYGSITDTATDTVTKECTTTTQPTYECSGVDALALGSNKYQFTVHATATSGATVNKYSYDFGDGSDVLSTDKNVAEHQYAKPGSYVTKVAVVFNVGDAQKSVNCQVSITIPEKPCALNPALPADSPDCVPCVYNPQLPKDSPKCVPPTVPSTPTTPNSPVSVIPSTGAAGVIAGIFGTSAVAYGAYAWVESRRTLKNM